MNPGPFSLYELLAMRREGETEEWDRLSFLLANLAKMAGSKDVDVSDFHKFKMAYKGLTKDNIKDLRKHFR
jgi:hypothetical protein